MVIPIKDFKIIYRLGYAHKLKSNACTLKCKTPSETRRHFFLTTSPKSSQSVHCFPYNGGLPPFRQKQTLCQFQVLIDRLLSRQTQNFRLSEFFLGIVRIK